MTYISKWIDDLIHKIINSPIDNTIRIFQFNEEDNEDDRQEAEQVMNNLAKELGRPDVKIITKNYFNNIRN